MILRYPCCITSRLLAGVRIGQVEVSIDYSDHAGKDGRTRYRYHIDGPGVSVTGDELQSGCQGGSLREGLQSLLSFLGAFGEAIAYQRRHGRESENGSLFPPALADWADANSDTIAMLGWGVEETPDCLVEVEI